MESSRGGLCSPQSFRNPLSPKWSQALPTRALHLPPPLLIFQPQSQTTPRLLHLPSTPGLCLHAQVSHTGDGEQELDPGVSFLEGHKLTGSGACSRGTVFAGRVSVDFKGEASVWTKRARASRKKVHMCT